MPDAAAADPSDRLTLGLLAHLCGDARTCEAAWSTIGDAGNHALVDAGLGRLMRDDNVPDEAMRGCCRRSGNCRRRRR